MLANEAQARQEKQEKRTIMKTKTKMTLSAGLQPSLLGTEIWQEKFPFWFYQDPLRKSSMHKGGSSKRTMSLEGRFKELINVSMAVFQHFQSGSEEDIVLPFYS